MLLRAAIPFFGKLVLANIPWVGVALGPGVDVDVVVVKLEWRVGQRRQWVIVEGMELGKVELTQSPQALQSIGRLSLGSALPARPPRSLRQRLVYLCDGEIRAETGCGGVVTAVMEGR